MTDSITLTSDSLGRLSFCTRYFWIDEAGIFASLRKTVSALATRNSHRIQLRNNNTCSQRIQLRKTIYSYGAVLKVNVRFQCKASAYQDMADK
jgi:hypothetical protein